MMGSNGWAFAKARIPFRVLTDILSWFLMFLRGPIPSTVQEQPPLGGLIKVFACCYPDRSYGEFQKCVRKLFTLMAAKSKLLV